MSLCMWFGFQVLMGSICVGCHEHKCYPIKNQVENGGIIGSYNKKKIYWEAGSGFMFSQVSVRVGSSH